MEMQPIHPQGVCVPTSLRGQNVFLLLSSLLICSALTGCGNSSSEPVIKIGCAAPLTGDQAQIGMDMCKGVQLAFAQANEKSAGLPGYKLEAVLLDDQHNPAQAVNVAKRLVSDRDVIAVIGHFNSSCTHPASAVYHASRMVQVTPASTNPEISKQGFDTFFRISATDDVQGPTAARYAVQKLGVKNVYVIDDKTTYGKGIADEFEKEIVKLGIPVLGHESITQGDKDFTPLLTKVKPLAPDLIFFGGIYPEGALLLKQARSLDMNMLLMGGDGLASPIFIELATAGTAEGTYMTMVGGDTRKIPEAQEFIRAFEARYGELGQWSAYGYDAANLLVTVIEKAGAKDREKVLAAIREIPSFKGITGEIIFDAKGDNQNTFIGMFKVENSKLIYVERAE